MDPLVKKEADILYQNYTALNKSFKWGSRPLNLAAAFLFSASGRPADPDALRRAEALLETKTRCFSPLRSNLKMPFLAKMVLSKDAEAYLDRVLALREKLGKSSVFNDDYIMLAAVILADQLGSEDPGQAAARTKAIYESIKERHKGLRSDESIPLAAALACSGMTPEAVTEEAERHYQDLRQVLKRSQDPETISYALVLSPRPAEEKAARFLKLLEALKAKKKRCRNDQLLIALVNLSFVDQPAERLAEETAAADDYLKELRGFGDFLLGPEERLIYAAQITVLRHLAPEKRSDNFIMSSSLTQALAAQLSLMLMTSSFVATMIATQ